MPPKSVPPCVPATAAASSTGSTRRVPRALAGMTAVVALFATPLVAGGQAHTSWTLSPTSFALTVNYDSNTVAGNRQTSAVIHHSDSNSPCSRIYQAAITDSAYAPGGGAHKWLSFAGGTCDFGAAGATTGDFYALASGEFTELCRGKSGALPVIHRKFWLSLFSTPSPSPTDVKQQLTQGLSYPFIANTDGYKEAWLDINVTCVTPPPPPPPVFTVTGADMSPVTYTGACPASVRFSGKVFVNMTGGVPTRFEFSDGVSSPTLLYHANAPGVTASYNREFKASASGFVRLHGGPQVSGNTPYTITCK